MCWSCVSESEYSWAVYYNQLYTGIHGLVVWRPSLLPVLVFLTRITLLSRVLFIYHYSKLWVLWQTVADTQKSEIKVERWKCYLAHSHVWNNNTRMIFPRLAGVVTFPGITTTRWRADVNRKEYQRRAIRKSSARQEWYSVRCAVVRISLVRSVPLFQVFPMFTLSLDLAHHVITSNLS